MSYACGPADWIDLAIGRLEDAKRSLRECDRLRQECDTCEELRQVVHFPLMDGWFMECAFTHDLIDVSSLRLKAPDSWEKLLGDLGEALQQGGRSGNPVCAYLAARGLCRGHMDEEGKCRFSDASFCANGMISNIRGRIKRLCAGDGE